MSDLYNAKNRMKAANAVAALAGGGQTGATLLQTQVSRITTVASGNDSVMLPVSREGDNIFVTNAHASNSANVYPQVGDNINALGANAAFALAAGKTAHFICTAAGQWHVILTA